VDPLVFVAVVSCGLLAEVQLPFTVGSQKIVSESESCRPWTARVKGWFATGGLGVVAKEAGPAT